MKHNATIILCAALVCAAVGRAFASERPVITAADVYVADDRVMGDLRVGGVFSDEIAGTVRSGLPAVVELLYELAFSDDGVVRRGVHTLELTYDVWDDVYTIARSDAAGGATSTGATTKFTSFEEMARAVERMRAVPIAPVGALAGGRGYVVAFSLAVHPLHGEERERIEGWVGETVRGPSKPSWREQVLNINELIHSFFARDDDDGNRSDWFSARAFRRDDLEERKP